MAMDSLLSFLQGFFLISIVGGSVYGFLCLPAFWRFQHCPPSLPSFSQWPPVTVLKPICGLEKNLRINLRSTCLQDYPDFQVVFSVGDPHDPAVPL